MIKISLSVQYLIGEKSNENICLIKGVKKMSNDNKHEYKKCQVKGNVHSDGFKA